MGAQKGSSPPAGVDLDVWTSWMQRLDIDLKDRVNLACVAGYMAAHTKNIAKIARMCGRSRAWVRKRVRRIEEILYSSGDEVLRRG